MDNVIDAARIELAREVDYELEARQQLEMKELLKGYEKVNVPKVFKEVSTKHVLAVEFVEGKPVNKVSDISQDERNSIAFRLLDITLLELFQYRFMQTDPNWSNFLLTIIFWHFSFKNLRRLQYIGNH
ncbi:hypothetical protein MHBO_003514 [Bonamia ostreae]|uniref:ABC1 atypical kinase-like domain-containing protein n=1 Tax=Bonamia ostreae TaxID=126728 RepID=A0ABV2AQQ5_9EUKA